MRSDLPPIDFVGLAGALLDRIDTLVPRWLPNGVERNGRWYVGDFDGGPGESANVCLSGTAAGCWIDNGGGDDERGGDLISLYARIRGLNNAQAARELMRELGWEKATGRHEPPPLGLVAPSAHAGEGGEPAATGEVQTHEQPGGAPAAEGAKKRVAKWRACDVVPPHAPAPSFVFGYKDKVTNHWIEQTATRTWRYELDGELHGYVARFERINSKGELVKDTVPLTWCENVEDGRGLQRWHWKQWEDPRPLYVPAGFLSADLSLPVVVVEGEKCAEALFKLLAHEFDVVSWPGGCKSWAFARWSLLMGRTVYLWPDCDGQREGLTKAEREAGLDPQTKPIKPEHKQPGMAAMVRIGTALLADHGCCTVNMCKLPAPGAVADGWDVADAIEQGWDAARVRDFIRAAVPFVPPSDEARAKAAAAPALAGAGEDESEAGGWRAKLLLTDKGTIKPCRENVVLAIDGMALPGGRWLPGIPEVKGVIAFNDFTNDVLKLKSTPWGTAAGKWGEEDELEMGCWLTREHCLPPMSRQTLEEAVSMVARRHRYHPAREHFEALRGKWDGEKRLSTWLSRTVRKDGGAADSEKLKRYLGLVGAWVAMAIVKRVLEPGCKFDCMLILEGPQGWGKSTLARTLGMNWFADTGLVLGDKDSYQNLQGVLVYEWGELDALTRAEVTKVKQFVSSQSDRFRASFDRRPKDYPRQVVFIGTTNEAHYLSDPTGNRRFWPVKLTRTVDQDWLRANLEQLFAEAVVRVEEGRRIYPTQDEQATLFEEEQQERTVESALESAIRRYLYDENQKVLPGAVNGSLVDEFTLCDLLTVLGVSVDKQTAQLTKQASAALGRLGWERGRSSPKVVGGEKVRPWVYRRPVESASVSDKPRASGAFDNGLTQGQTNEERDVCPF